MSGIDVAKEGTMRVVTIDTRAYGLNAVLKTAYWFTDRAFLHLQYGSGHEIELRLRPKRSDTDGDSLAGDFMNELLEQQLRDAVAAETEGMRDLIFAHALSRTSLLNRELETADPFADPYHVGSRVRNSSIEN